MVVGKIANTNGRWSRKWPAGQLGGLASSVVDYVNYSDKGIDFTWSTPHDVAEQKPLWL